MGIFNKKNIKSHIQIDFLTSLIRLLELGYSLNEALVRLQWSTTHVGHSKQIERAILSGKTLYEAFETSQFDDYLLMYLHLVEHHTDILEVLKKALTMYEIRLNQLNRLKQVLKYPMLLFIIFSSLLMVVKKYILPSFLTFFIAEDNSSTLIMFIINLIEISTTLMITSLIALFILILACKYHSKKIEAERYHRYLIQFPFIKKMFSLVISYQFSLQLGMYLKAGLTIKQAFEAIDNKRSNILLRYYIKRLSEQLNKGFKLNSMMHGLPLITDELAHIFKREFNLITLERDLMAYSYLIGEQITQKTEGIISKLQPVLFIVVALFIVFIYGSLMWPMFELMKTI